MLSLGDVITLSFLIKLICNQIGFYSNFWSKFLESKVISVKKSSKSCPDYVEKNRIYIKRDWIYIKNDQKSQNISTFLIKFDFLDLLIDFSNLLIDFNVIFLIFLIKNWLDSIDFNQKEIKIRSKLWATIRTAWNPNCQWLDAGA